MQEHRALEHELQIYAFEPKSIHLAKLRATLTHIKTSLPASVLEAAAWIADEEVGATPFHKIFYVL